MRMKIKFSQEIHAGRWVSYDCIWNKTLQIAAYAQTHNANHHDGQNSEKWVKQGLNPALRMEDVKTLTQEIKIKMPVIIQYILHLER